MEPSRLLVEEAAEVLVARVLATRKASAARWALGTRNLQGRSHTPALYWGRLVKARQSSLLVAWCRGTVWPAFGSLTESISTAGQWTPPPVDSRLREMPTRASQGCRRRLIHVNLARRLSMTRSGVKCRGKLPRPMRWLGGPRVGVAACGDRAEVRVALCSDSCLERRVVGQGWGSKARYTIPTRALGRGSSFVDATEADQMRCDKHEKGTRRRQGLRMRRRRESEEVQRAAVRLVPRSWRPQHARAVPFTKQGCPASVQAMAGCGSDVRWGMGQPRQGGASPPMRFRRRCRA